MTRYERSKVVGDFAEAAKRVNAMNDDQLSRSMEWALPHTHPDDRPRDRQGMIAANLIAQLRRIVGKDNLG